MEKTFLLQTVIAVCLFAFNYATLTKK